MRDLLNILDSIDMIVESPKSDFKQMFQAIEKVEGTTDVMQFARNHFKWAYGTFQTNGKPNGEHILWYMRYIRLYALYKLAKTTSKEMEEMFLPVFDKEANKMSNKIGHSVDDIVGYAQEMSPMNSWTHTKFEHFKSLDLDGIDMMTFGWDAPGEIIQKMEKIEERWKENARFNIDHDDYERSSDRHFGKPEKLIDFGDGFAWWDLARPSCSIEGNAMGHCGNSPRSYSDDTVLSLRKEVKQKGKTYYQPYLTFILQSDGTLGEMKGRFNEKPQAEFHPYIVKLLRHESIKGVEGGGYLAQNNFDMSDLDDDEREGLEDEKPELKNPMSGLREKEFKDITQEDLNKIYDKMRDKNVAPYEVNLVEGEKGRYIELETFGDAEVFVNDKFEYNHPVHSLIKVLDDPDQISEEIDFDAEDLDDSYYVELIRRLSDWYQRKIFDEAGVDDPERAVWKLQRERHRFWEYMVDAFNKAHVFKLDDEYKGELQYFGKTYRGAIEARVMEYIDETPLNPYDAGLKRNGFNDELTLYLDNHHLLIDAWEAAADDEYAYEIFDNGDIYGIMDRGWGYQEDSDRYPYNEMFGEQSYRNDDQGPMINDKGTDRLIAELGGQAGSIKLIDALDAFEKQFDLRESDEPADNLLNDIIRLAKI